MEANVCGVNHLDSDVLLPPRKRLLACLKRQNSDVNGDSNSNSNSVPDSPSIHNSFDQLDARISYLLKAHLSNDNPSQEEIVTASRAAAEAAVKVALAARAAAQVKAVAAAKAMAAAKKALEFVANVEDGQELSASLEQQLRKSKTKKQIDVQMLYDNSNPRLENGKTNDEELARKLHQAINSSPRISNSSDVKNHKHKRLKTSENGPNLESGSKAKGGDDDVTIKKRGRVKQKKLPLSVCQYRDQAGPKGDVIRSPLSTGPSETGPLWKCKAFKTPVCVKPNNVMQL